MIGFLEHLLGLGAWIREGFVCRAGDTDIKIEELQSLKRKVIKSSKSLRKISYLWPCSKAIAMNVNRLAQVLSNVLIKDIATTLPYSNTWASWKAQLKEPGARSSTSWPETGRHLQ